MEEIDRVFNDYLDEGFEFRLRPDYPEGELGLRDHGGVDQLRAMLRETCRECRIEPERFLDAEDRVVVFARIVGRRAVRVDDPRLDDPARPRGLGTRGRDRSYAVEAAGLSEYLGRAKASKP